MELHFVRSVHRKLQVGRHIWRSVFQASGQSRTNFKIRSSCSKPWQVLKISKGDDWTAPLGPCLSDALLSPTEMIFSLFPISISLVAACDCCLLFFCCAPLRNVYVCLLQWNEVVEDCSHLLSWPSCLQPKQGSCPCLSLYLRCCGSLIASAALPWSLSRLWAAVGVWGPNSSCGAVCSALSLAWHMGHCWPQCTTSFAFVELNESPASLLLWFLEVLLNGNPALSSVPLLQFGCHLMRLCCVSASRAIWQSSRVTYWLSQQVIIFSLSGRNRILDNCWPEFMEYFWPLD